MELINSPNVPVASDEGPTIATATAAKEATNSTVRIISVKSDENNKQTSVLEAELQRNDAPEAEETREAEEDASQMTAPTDNTKSTTTHKEVQNANNILASAIETDGAAPISEIVVKTEEDITVVAEEREGVESTTTSTAAGIEKVLEEYGAPLPDDACWNAVNEETTKAWSKMNEESTKAWSTVNDETSKAYNEMSVHLTKFNESASQVYTQTVNGMTTAYVMAEEDLSLIGLALTQTKTAKSLNEFLKTENTASGAETDETAEKIVENEKEDDGEEDEEEYEGEGMEVSLSNRIGDTRTLSEI